MAKIFKLADVLFSQAVLLKLYFKIHRETKCSDHLPSLA